MAAVAHVPGLAVILGGGFLVGFGTAYAGGCTSGHGVSGVADLQLPRGRHDDAVAEFGRAVWSVTDGYSRTNLELARSLMALGRAREAISVLQAALRSSSLESSSLYVTQTELREQLGLAWEAAGTPDSAAVHYRWVLRAWSAADPELHGRRDTLARRLGNITSAGRR